MQDFSGNSHLCVLRVPDEDGREHEDNRGNDEDKAPGGGRIPPVEETAGKTNILHNFAPGGVEIINQAGDKLTALNNEE